MNQVLLIADCDENGIVQMTRCRKCHAVFGLNKFRQHQKMCGVKRG